MKFLSWREAVNENKKLIVLFMTTSWCESCEEQEKELLEIEDERVSLVKEDADERLDLAVRYTPQIYPTISLVSKNSLIGGTYGLVKRGKLLEMISEALELIEGKGKLIVPPKLSSKKIDKFPPDYAFNHILRVCEGYFDWKEGGFEREPKHVSPEVLQLFLRFNDYYHKIMAEVTLDNVIEYLWENGFYMFSKSRDWKEPYKAKLLDYNAEMVKTLVKAYQVLKKEIYLDYAIATTDWLLSKRDSRGYFINGEFLGVEDKRPFLNVNANVGDAFMEVYRITNDKKYLEIAKDLEQRLVLAHRMNVLSPPYLIDLASYLNFLSKLNPDKARNLLNILDDYKGSEAYYDTTLRFATENKIGRFNFLYDNVLLANTLINLNIFEEAKRIVDMFLSSYSIYAYFNQAKYALVLGEIYGLFTH
ncbi:hypothetical protein GO599_01945 [Sulfolobus islandicus]|uniref:Uncharacterized protein n=1 Tax=Saccharolobus islandicus (strain HVE10/4) TaxID=930943 RepID=F0NJV5_SACI0|nr:thioredoxin domain-containing protein [Sulfolobus islandicus]ADX82271.1 conserved hypothetical protein [Sulfolobus islandicus HVE10/4]WCM36414.1 hypothetical protein GO599_01945 [Sulfolobus islandicus]